MQPKHQALILVDSLFWNYFHNKDLGKEWLKRFLQASTQIAGKEYSEVCEELVKKLTFACLQETADKFDYCISAMHVLFALFASSSVQDIGVFHEELYLLLQECRLTVNDWIAFQKDMLLLVFRVIREILQQHQKQNIPLISGETESLLFEKLSKMCLVVRDGAVALLELCKQHDLQQGFHNANTTSQAVGRQLQQYVTTDLQQWILSQLGKYAI